MFFSIGIYMYKLPTFGVKQSNPAHFVYVFFFFLPLLFHCHCDYLLNSLCHSTCFCPGGMHYSIRDLRQSSWTEQMS
ncbi:uncharacterized protein BJX67DRAFT_338884 [Aspergillus lucknowensis]|uniref:Uncharacterized protein n=1 Tax=Aspergillus lucknowensis TaxID=176173 RepID=A0ABR4L5N2_9EURO